jgi:branched-chain amino acid transport system ATP-binding protein
VSDLVEIRHLSKRFGGITALEDVSFTVGRGETLAVIGPNGAGKTTLFNCVTGFGQPDAGEVWFDGERIDKWSPDRRARRGLVRTFQNIRMFAGLTTYESLLASVPSGDRRVRKEIVADAVRLIERLDLETVADRVCNELPLLAQRSLEVARALMTHPIALLLDEPTAGATVAERETLATLIANLQSTGVSVVLIEHNVPFVMAVSSRVVVMHFGRVVAVGPPESVANDPAVQDIYLGT